MAWLMVDQSLPTHRKTMAAADRLDISPVEMVGHLVTFWLWALDNAPDGCLAGVTDRSVARAGAWEGDASAFAAALRHAGFLDMEGDLLIIHDWWDYAGKLMERRRANAERMRAARATHVPHTDDARAGATVQESTVENSTTPEIHLRGEPADSPKPAKPAKKRPMVADPEAAEPREDRQMWAVLCKLFEVPEGEQFQPEARGKWNTAIGRFRAAGVKPDDLPEKFQVYCQRFGSPPASPLAMVAQLPLLHAAPPRNPNGRAPPAAKWPAVLPETRPNVQAMREELKRGISPG